MNKYFLPSEVHQNVLNEIISKKLITFDKDYAIEFSEGSSKGDNYMGEIHRIQLKNKKGS